MPVSRPAGDTGQADPAVAAALSAYAAGAASEYSVLTAIAVSRLLVPVVAVLAEGGAHGKGAHGTGAGTTGTDGTEEETEMALPTLIGNDGRRAVIAFTATETIKRWRSDARPVPVPAARLWPAAESEGADAVVIDVAGPVPLVVEGARLRALAAGASPPHAYEDQDVRAAVAAVFPEFTLAPGGPEAELAITLKTADPAVARAAAQQIATLLAPRLRLGVAIRLG
jgi:hypothetical protein